MAKAQKPAKMPAGYFGWALLDGERGCVTLKDALHNLSSSENGNNHEFSKGLIVGVVSVLMAGGMEYDDACQLVWQLLPAKCHYQRFPDTWRERFAGKIDKATIPA